MVVHLIAFSAAPSWAGLILLVCAAVWCFAKASNDRDEFAGLVGHGIVALACFGVVGFGLAGNHPWMWVAAGLAFAVNAVFLMVRIRQT
jgi:hypothetical protein